MKSNHALRRKFTRQFYHGNIGYLILSILCQILQAGTSIYIAWLMQILLDVSTADSRYSIGQVGLCALAGLLFYLLETLLLYNSLPRFRARAMSQYRNFAFSELVKKNISAFSGENSALYLSALNNDATAIENGYLTGLISIVGDILLFTGGLTLMLLYSPILTGISIATAFLPILVSILTGNRLAAAEQALSEQNEHYMATLKDSLSGFSVIKSFQAEKIICQQVAKNVRNMAHAKCRQERIEILLSGIGQAAGLISQFGVFFAGAWLALSGKGITPGILIAFVQIMNYVLGPIQSIPQALAKRKAAVGLIDKLAAALDENHRDDGVRIQPQLHNGIHLEHVSFSYDGSRNALDDVNVDFECGKSYAIVGSSGSGKSTLLNLLMGSYANYDGLISYDDMELRNISSTSLFELVSVIQQNVFVFNHSVRDNVTMFRSFDDDAVTQAMELSGLIPFIESRGADTPCGENGCNLSGGEKQRISIARSLLRNTPVLLIDEATAALDAQTADRVINSILDLQNLTRIVVTHSLEECALRRYDCILAMKNGRIVESGHFDHLMAEKGYFYSLYTVSQ